MLFGQMFLVAGANFDDEDYPTLKLLAVHFQTYRNSIGDIGTPQYDYWTYYHRHFDKSVMFGYGQCMIYLIWILWYLNQFFNLIILLNFLIAIVSQSYEKVMTDSMKYEYEHKAELNSETERFFRMIFTPKAFDIMCTVSSHEDDDFELDANESITLIMKSYIRGVLKNLHEFVKLRFEKSEKMAKLADKGLTEYIDEQFADLLQRIDKITKEVTLMKSKIDKEVNNAVDPDKGKEEQMEKHAMLERAMRQIFELEDTMKTETRSRQKEAK